MEVRQVLTEFVFYSEVENWSNSPKSQQKWKYRFENTFLDLMAIQFLINTHDLKLLKII